MWLTLRKAVQKLKIWDGTNALGITADGEAKTLDTSIDNAVDGLTNAITNISFLDHKIHKGSHYKFKEFHDLLQAGYVEYLMVTPDTANAAHLKIAVGTVSSSATVELFEAPTTTATGTETNSKNSNRNNDDDNTSLVYKSPNVALDGTKLWSLKAGQYSVDNEREILKRNTVYLVRITENNIEATAINLNLDWYEHTDPSI